MKRTGKCFNLTALILICSLSASAQLKTDSTGIPSYYVDGYHGGIIGHMPAGSFRDIVNGLERYPSWKISFDIEPLSWRYLKMRDPEIFLKVKGYLNDYSAKSRLEIVAPAYMQPYCWNISGESNIRQLVMGLDELHQSFPGYPVKTYAVQEPCWTSSLPQILMSLGFTQAVLKDPATAFGGYTRGINKSTIFWKGPDGTSIPAVPRYACENLNTDAWETESCSVTPDFIEKCYKNGIQFPVGNQYQDLGWPAHPAVDSTGRYVYMDPGLKYWPDTRQFDHYWWNKKPDQLRSYPQLITWREYFANIVPAPEDSLKLSQEDLQVNLMWGSGVLNSIAQKVHKTEKLILQTEKFSSMAYALSGYSVTGSRVDYLWEQLLTAQHHDAWICPLADNITDHWASLVTLKTGIANQIATEITDESINSLTNRFQKQETTGENAQLICVLNSSGFDRSENIEVVVAFDPGVMHCEVSDKYNVKIRSQLIPTSWYGDGSINSARIIFSATIPSLGYDFFRLKTARKVLPVVEAIPTCLIKKTSDHEYTLETDLYKLTINPAKGGCITSLYDKSLEKEFVDLHNERSFNEYRGYFSLDNSWLSSKDSSATVQILEDGPLRIKAVLRGKIGRYPFETVVTMAAGEKQIDFRTRFFFNSEVLIGEPWIGKRPTRGEHRKPCYDTRWKLQAFFPSSFKNQVLYKNAPYDVCTSRLEDTFFNTWSDIKHNIILDWVDIYDPLSNAGLALFSDRTTSYSHGKNYPLALTMGWSGYGLWEAFYPMSETAGFNYAIVPHLGKWNDARISQINSSWNEPLITKIIHTSSGSKPDGYSLMKVSDERIEIPTLFIRNNSLFVRLFNSSDRPTTGDLTLGLNTPKIELTEVDGKVIKETVVIKTKNRSTVPLNFRPFELKTLKIQF